MRRIQIYSPLGRRVDNLPSNVDARVAVRLGPEQARATIDLERPEGSTHREVAGNSCAEVVRAAALIVALAADPDAGADANANANANRGDDRAESDHVPSSARVFPPFAARSWFEVGGIAGLTGGIAPRLAPYQGVFVELGPWTRGPFVPSIRLEALLARQTVDAAVGAADFALLTARIAGCPVHLGLVFFVEPCLTFDYGRLDGQGHTALLPSSARATWYGPGAAVHAGANALKFIALSVDAGVVAPLAHDRFYFGPDITVYRIPSLAAYIGLSLSFRVSFGT